MKKRINILLPIIMILLISSCSDEDLGLSQTDPNALVAETFYTDVSSVERTLNATYSALLSHGFFSVGTEAARSDLAYGGRRGQNGGSDYLDWYNLIINPSNRYVSDQWRAIYKLAFRANQTIEALDFVRDDPDQDRWVQIMGEARFLRALAHYTAYVRFNNGSIIIRDEVGKSNEDLNRGLSAKEDVVDFIRADLKYAMENLDARSSISAGSYRASTGAAAALLGKSYLIEEQYDSAFAVFGDLISSGEYQLADPELMFTFDGENSAESIFEINFTGDPVGVRFDDEAFQHRWARSTAPFFNVPGGAQGGNHQIFPAAWLAYEYGNEPLDEQNPKNYTNGVVGDSTTLRPVSLRASAMVALVQDTLTEYYTGVNAADRIVFSPGTFISVGFFKKYTSHDIVFAEGDTNNDPFLADKNVTLIRFADVLLMQAECALKKASPDVTTALTLVNLVRERWALRLLGPPLDANHDYDGITYTTTSLMNHIMSIERPLELSAEGISTRIIDLNRWGIREDRYTQLSNDNYYVTGFNFIDSDGMSTVEPRSLVMRGASPGGPNDAALDFEYDAAASNYESEVHDYLPIPTEEQLTNSEI